MLFSDTKAKRALGSSTRGSPVQSKATRHCLQSHSQGFAGAVRLLWQPGKRLASMRGCARTGRVLRGGGGSQCHRRDGCSDCRAIRFPDLAGLSSVLTHVFCVGAFVNRSIS